MTQLILRPVQMGSGDFLARGRQEHAPHESEKRRHSASLAQVENGAVPFFVADAEGGGTGSAMLSAGDGADAATGSELSAGAGRGATSPRLHDTIA